MEKKAAAKNGNEKLKNGSKKNNQKNTPHKKDFLVVGLGASAGGVKALQEFFATMPPNSGMAFVVILHLSPEHESSLPQILQAQTQMKVTQVTKTVKVEPNNVYVIPPNVQLEMMDGMIRPQTAERPLGHRVAIDVFFRTLAEAYEKNAVCVVLSGTGSDGTLGLKRVKESNGFAIVQDPEDAEYDSMPRSAINTQLTDWILPVHKMPEKLINFRESSERLHLTNGADAQKVAEGINADESLREILTILRVRTGHDFSNYKMPTLIRRIARHLQIHELEDIPTYLGILRQNPNEVQSLLKNLLINVTNFFRDKEAFDALSKTVVPKIFEGKTGKDTLRIWSCGCASGEEAYSLAMILQECVELLPDPPKFQVFASDVDEEALSEAREHRYAESIEADVSPERLKRFFTKEGSFYRVKKELREAVLFAPHNVLHDPPFSRLDLISCRNLLIYLNREAQERVLQIFHFALNNQGFLFLGSSESADGAAHLFTPVDKKQRIYSRRFAGPAQNYLPAMPTAGRWQMRLPDEKVKTPREHQITLSEIHYKLLENYAPSSILVNQDFDIVYLSGTAGKFLHFTGGEPSHNILKAVNPELLPDLRAALFTAQREHQFSEFPNVTVTIDSEPRVVNIIVRAVDVPDELSDFLLVIFEERNTSAVVEAAKKNIEHLRDKDEAMEAVVRRLEEDLQRTKEHLRFTIEQHETTIEEHKAANEELQAINEELRSAGEELETSKEELQSVNEELTTVNHEFKEKIDEATRINSDLSNLVAATNIATIFLDKNLQIKRYTPLVEQLFNITPHDIGRPLEHFTHNLNFEKLTAEAAKVLRFLKPFERETTDMDGNIFLARFLPYRTIDDRIEGVVLNFIDITERKQAENRMREFEDRFRAFVTASSDAVYSMNADWSEMRFLKGKSFIPDTETPNADWLEKYILPEDRQQVLAVINEAIRTKSIFELEHRVIRVDGTPGWTFARAIPITGAAGDIVEWFGTASDITTRKEIERALTESEEKYRLLFNSMDEGYFLADVVFDENNRPVDIFYLDANPAADQLVGTALAGRRLREIDPGYEEYWFEIFGRVALTGENVRLERYAEPDRKWYGFYVFKVGGADSRRVAVIFQNITERRQSEKSIDFQAQLLDAVEQAVIATDLEGKIIFWNDFAEKLFGWPAAEALGQSIIEINTPQVSQAEAEKIMAQLRRGESWQGEFLVQRRDGTMFPAQVFNSPIYDDRKNLIGIIGVSTDITERRRSDETIRKSEEQLRLILESTKDYAIIVFDLNGIITRWNAGAEKAFGYTEDEIIGQSGEIVFTLEDRIAKVPEKEMQTTLEKGRAEDERWHLRKDGTRFYVSGVMQPLKDGKIEGFVKIARDQTERIEAESALREKETLQKLVSAQEDERKRIARDLHDELGQQLTALRIKLDALKNDLGDAVLLNQVNEIREIARSIDDGVDFLAWELRPSALEDLGLAAALTNYVKQWSHYAGVKADFIVSNLKRARFNHEVETCLYRIVQEALNNTHKHAQATIAEIVLEKRDDMLILIIEDNGKGFNLKSKTNRSKGIGIIGMKERAALVGGTFEIESAPKKGTTIYVRIPFSAAKEK